MSKQFSKCTGCLPFFFVVPALNDKPQANRRPRRSRGKHRTCYHSGCKCKYLLVLILIPKRSLYFRTEWWGRFSQDGVPPRATRVILQRMTRVDAGRICWNVLAQKKIVACTYLGRGEECLLFDSRRFGLRKGGGGEGVISLCMAVVVWP